MKEKLFGAILGFTVGDALGVPVEFIPGDALAEKPVTELIGYGSHNLPPGSWSDDSSLTFCLIDSIIHHYSIDDLAKRFIRWRKEGYWTPFGEAFSIGRTTEYAILQLETGISPLSCGGSSERDNGNGGLMRVLPLAFLLKGKPIEDRVKVIDEVTSITHAHSRSKIASVIYVEFAIQLLGFNDKFVAYEQMKEIVIHFYKNTPYEHELSSYHRLIADDISKLERKEIKSTGWKERK